MTERFILGLWPPEEFDTRVPKPDSYIVHLKKILAVKDFC